MVEQKFRDVDAYIASLPKPAQAQLRKVREAIRGAVPDAEEFISYHMPAYRLNGNLLYFAAYKNHYSVFGVTSASLKGFPDLHAERGTIRFSYDEPVPVK